MPVQTDLKDKCIVCLSTNVLRGCRSLDKPAIDAIICRLGHEMVDVLGCNACAAEHVFLHADCVLGGRERIYSHPSLAVKCIYSDFPPLIGIQSGTLLNPVPSR